MSRRRSIAVSADVNSTVNPATAAASSSYLSDKGMATKSVKNPTAEPNEFKNGPID